MSITVLHERENQGLYVQLIWNPEADRVYIEVRDRTTGDVFLVEPPRADVLDAFYHPFFYAAVAETNVLSTSEWVVDPS